MTKGIFFLFGILLLTACGEQEIKKRTLHVE